MEDFAPLPAATSAEATRFTADPLIPAEPARIPRQTESESAVPLMGRYDSMLDRARDLLRGAAYKFPPTET